MTNTVLQLIAQGENAQVEFKSSDVRPDSIAREITAFANTLGGTLLIGVEGIDLRLVDHYYQTYYETDFLNLSTEEQLNLLNNADILTELESKQVITVGGLLMFGKYPQRRLPHSSIMFAVFKGDSITDDLIDKKEIVGTLPELIDKTVALLQLFLPSPSIIEGTQRTEITLIPIKVLREAMVNAVVHRDYSLSQRKIQVHIFSDRIEITSPGKLANTLTLAKIRYGNSAPRNIFLVKFLDNLRYFDGLGRGIPMMLKLT